METVFLLILQNGKFKETKEKEKKENNFVRRITSLGLIGRNHLSPRSAFGPTEWSGFGQSTAAIKHETVNINIFGRTKVSMQFTNKQMRPFPLGYLTNYKLVAEASKLH